MNISGSSSYLGLYDYNSIKENRSQTDVENVGEQHPFPSKELQTDAEEVRAKQKYTSADYAQQYQKGVE